jgi:hypothetical protein
MSQRPMWVMKLLEEQQQTPDSIKKQVTIIRRPQQPMLPSPSQSQASAPAFAMTHVETISGQRPPDNDAGMGFQPQQDAGDRQDIGDDAQYKSDSQPIAQLPGTPEEPVALVPTADKGPVLLHGQEGLKPLPDGRVQVIPADQMSNQQDLQGIEDRGNVPAMAGGGTYTPMRSPGAAMMPHSTIASSTTQAQKPMRVRPATVGTPYAPISNLGQYQLTPQQLQAVERRGRFQSAANSTILEPVVTYDPKTLKPKDNSIATVDPNFNTLKPSGKTVFSDPALPEFNTIADQATALRQAAQFGTDTTSEDAQKASVQHQEATLSKPAANITAAKNATTIAGYADAYNAAKSSSPDPNAAAKAQRASVAHQEATLGSPKPTATPAPVPATSTIAPAVANPADKYTVLADQALTLMTQTMNGMSPVDRTIANRYLQQYDASASADNTALMQNIANDPNLSQGAKNAMVAMNQRNIESGRATMEGTLATAAQTNAQNAQQNVLTAANSMAATATVKLQNQYNEQIAAGDFTGAQATYKQMTGQTIDLNSLKLQAQQTAKAAAQTTLATYATEMATTLRGTDAGGNPNWMKDATAVGDLSDMWKSDGDGSAFDPAHNESQKDWADRIINSMTETPNQKSIDNIKQDLLENIPAQGLVIDASGKLASPEEVRNFYNNTLFPALTQLSALNGNVAVKDGPNGVEIVDASGNQLYPPVNTAQQYVVKDAKGNPVQTFNSQADANTFISQNSGKGYSVSGQANADYKAFIASDPAAADISLADWQKLYNGAASWSARYGDKPNDTIVNDGTGSYIVENGQARQLDPSSMTGDAAFGSDAVAVIKAGDTTENHDAYTKVLENQVAALKADPTQAVTLISQSGLKEDDPVYQKLMGDNGIKTVTGVRTEDTSGAMSEAITYFTQMPGAGNLVKIGGRLFIEKSSNRVVKHGDYIDAKNYVLTDVLTGKDVTALAQVKSQGGGMFDGKPWQQGTLTYDDNSGTYSWSQS